MIQNPHRLRFNVLAADGATGPHTRAEPKCPGCAQHLELHDAPLRIPAGYRLEPTHTESGERNVSQFGACPHCRLVFEDVNAVTLVYEEVRKQVVLAAYRARLARELFDAGDAKVPAALTELAEAFGCLEGQPGVRPFSSRLLDDWTCHCPLSCGEHYCAAFVLHVADATSCWAKQFDVAEAMEHWAPAQRAVFLEWAKAPWWA
jgi:hypothetical protein